MDINITISDTHYKAMEVIAYDPIEWITNAVEVRARAAIDEAVQQIVNEALEAGSPLPQGTKEEIFLAANLPTAKELTDAAMAEELP